jgi:hypothetical protein
VTEETRADSFYRQIDDDRFVSTEHTIGPWSNDAQHAGPPSALLGRAIQTTGEHTEFHVARITFEILRPIPIEELRIRTEVVRSGRSVELIEATLATERATVMTARAWRIRETGPHDLDAPLPHFDVPPGPDEATALPELYEAGYLHAMEIKFVRGSFVEKGPATAWFRMRHPLVAGEEPSPLTRVLIASDSGNGISAALDWRDWFFVNPDLTVYLHRLPQGEWVCLDARTTPGENGVGVAASTIYDRTGHLGYGMQSLFISPR